MVRGFPFAMYVDEEETGPGGRRNARAAVRRKLSSVPPASGLSLFQGSSPDASIAGRVRVLDPVTGHRVSPGRLEISSKGKWVKAFMQRLVKSGGGCGRRRHSRTGGNGSRLPFCSRPYVWRDGSSRESRDWFFSIGMVRASLTTTSRPFGVTPPRRKPPVVFAAPWPYEPPSLYCRHGARVPRSGSCRCPHAQGPRARRERSTGRSGRRQRHRQPPRAPSACVVPCGGRRNPVPPSSPRVGSLADLRLKRVDRGPQVVGVYRAAPWVDAHSARAPVGGPMERRGERLGVWNRAVRFL